MSKIFRLLGVFFLLLLLTMPAFAAGRVIIDDTTGQADKAAVERAAAPLASKNATVIVLVSDNTGSDPQSYAQQRYRALGLSTGGGLDPSAIIYLVALDRKNAYIYYGSDWNSALNPTYSDIINQAMIPHFARNDVTGGITAGLTATVAAIETPPGSGPNYFLWTLLGLGGAGVAGTVGYRAYSKRRTIAQAFAKARQSAEDARRQAGAAIADLGQDMQAAKDKAQFDQVSYAAADVKQLAQLQGEAEAQFVKAQEQFDKAGEALAVKQTPAQEDYQATAEAYAGVTSMVEAARQPLAQAEARRAELDKLNAQAPGEVDRAKKALADVAERLRSLGQDFAHPDAITQPAADLVARTEALLAEHRAADAIASAGAASATIDELNQTLARYADLREGISAGRAAAEKVATQGYRVEPGLAAFNTAEGVLRQAADALERNVGQARTLLDQAEAARAQGVARGGGMPALRQENDGRLEQAKADGEQLDAYIAEGRKAFDLVDEFAENTWSDIRGNGSEAETAAARARSLWERAAKRNTMEEQDFLGAKQDLDAMQEQLNYAHTLIDTIIQRLKDLEAARAAAHDEIAAAQADIDQGWGYVRSNDPDVGKVPEQALAKAAALLEQANAELKKERPDWLAIVKQAQEANRTADEALAAARSEVEAMGKLRDQAARAQQLATAEVQKIVQFASVHGDDIPKASENKLNALQSDVQKAYQTLQGAERAEEQARAAALRDAVARYTDLQSSADKLYDEIYAAFQRMEELRQRLADEVGRAQTAIAGAERTMNAYSGVIRPSSEGVRLLQQASATISSIGSPQGEDALKRALPQATEARNAAERADEIFRDQATVFQQAQQRNSGGAGDFITGAVIGSLLSGDGGHHHQGGGGWSGGGGGGGGGSWGGGGGGGWGGSGGGGGSGW